MGEEERRGEVAPAELGDEFFRRRVAGRASPPRRPRPRRPPAGRNLAEPQMRREARGRLARGLVAAVRVAWKRAVDETGERGARARFARRLAERKLARPVGLGRREPERFDRDAFRRHARAMVAAVSRAGAGRWRGEGAKGAMAAPEGGKAAGRGAVRLCGLPRLAHEPAVEAQGLDAALAQAPS